MGKCAPATLWDRWDPHAGRKGPRIGAKGIYRDGVRSARGPGVHQAQGRRGISLLGRTAMP